MKNKFLGVDADLKNGTKYKKIIITAAIAAAVLALLFLIAEVTALYEEKAEIGYTSIFLKNIETGTIVGAVCLLIIFIVFAVNLFVTRINEKRIFGDFVFFRTKKKMFLWALAAAFVFAIFTAKKTAPLYLSYYSSLPFGETDPIFGRDIGYYMFQRPFMSAVFDSVKIVFSFQLIYTAALYAAAYLRTDFLSFKNIFTQKRIIIHIVVLAFLLFTAYAFSMNITAEGILFGEFGNLSGAGFTDVTVWRNYYTFFPILLLLSVAAACLFIKRGKVKNAVISAALIPASYVLVILCAFIVQLAFVKPYEVSMERQYITYNIDATRRGFSLQNVSECEYLAENGLTSHDIKDEYKTIDNIRITDLNQTLTATNSIQGLRSFYTFKDNDIVTLDYNGTKTAFAVSVRELDTDKLPESAQSYINKKLRYTHGYGIVASPLNKVTEEGQPEYLIKDIPTYSETGMPKIEQPRIYFGEHSNDYAIVKTKYSELDYMEGDRTVEYSYDGKAGIKLNLFNRFSFAVRCGDPMLLFSGYITGDSKILCNRNVINRVKKAVPFLKYDKDPYVVIDYDGRIKWVIDAYTISDKFPYAQKYDGVNYIRNSVKAVVDAYDGNVEFYITDTDDPVIRVLSRMYPGVFHEDELPLYISEQMHYPEYLFKLRSEVYKSYHITEPEALYSRSDIWVTAKEKYAGGESVDVEPYYNLMKLDGEDSESLVLMQPYTPQGKENLVAWMAVGSGADNYGKTVVYRFPKGKTVYGTLHIENKIDNDPNISKEISLWDQGGSNVIKGNLLVIPIKESLLYVEPIYITAKNSAALPEVKRIAVAYGDKVAMEPTIGEALDVIFANKTPSAGDDEEKTLEMLIDEASKKYNEMQSYSANGGYKAFGAALDELGKIFDEIEEKRAESSQAENTDNEADQNTAATEER